MLILTRAAVNPVLSRLPLTCPILTVEMEQLVDGGEYQTVKPPVIIQVTVSYICGHTPWLQSRLVTESSTFTIRNKL